MKISSSFTKRTNCPRLIGVGYTPYAAVVKKIFEHHKGVTTIYWRTCRSSRKYLMVLFNPTNWSIKKSTTAKHCRLL